MLRTYVDVSGAGDRGEGSDVSDDRLLMCNPLWHQGSFAELFRCLYEMRRQKPQPDENGHSLYWHVSHRYLRVETRITLGCPGCGIATREGTRHSHHDGTQVKRFDRGPIVEERWHKGVDLSKVQISERNPRPVAIDWIVREHRGSPFLPLELYRLVAA